MLTEKEKRLKILLNNLKVHHQAYKRIERQLKELRLKMVDIRSELVNDYGLDLPELPESPRT